jgi:hypothetical protein
MTHTPILTVLFTAAVAVGAHAAGPQSEQCRMWSCRIVSPTVTASLAPDTRPAAVRVGSQDIPVTEMMIFAPSTDGQLYACIGYDPFGDPEIKCLLVP